MPNAASVSTSQSPSAALVGSMPLAFVSPEQSLQTLSQMCFDHLLALVEIDSQSDEESKSIPSTLGQIVLGQKIIERIGDRPNVTIEVDGSKSVLVTLKSNIQGPDQPEPIAFMVHMDTSKGTIATRDLTIVPNWDGSRLHYSANPALEVSAERYPHVAALKGQTVIHGPGKGPFGLDDKLGAAELLTLLDVITSNPSIPHGEIILGFRADEEIGRHEAVEELSKTLAARGVRLGWTMDGHLPFEVNVANFNASRVDVTINTVPLPAPDATHMREVIFDIQGVDTHGATAHEEGYLNASIIFARAFQTLGAQEGITFVDFDRTTGKETSGVLKAIVSANTIADLDSRVRILRDALESEIEPHRWKGADLLVKEQDFDPAAWNFKDGAIQVAKHLNTFLTQAQVSPLLSEQSYGELGYSNPHWVKASEDTIVVRYRIRDFNMDVLHAREADLARICEETKSGTAVVTPQYVDMGPALAKAPQLTDYPRAAFAPLADLTPFSLRMLPVRGGTGVDKFSELGTFIGNIGTGYYFIESPKELTTLELQGQHCLLLVNLVQVVAKAGAAKI